jgi:hypothetical protein
MHTYADEDLTLGSWLTPDCSDDGRLDARATIEAKRASSFFFVADRSFASDAVLLLSGASI